MRVLGLVAVTACSFSATLSEPVDAQRDDAAAGEAGLDANVDSSNPATCSTANLTCAMPPELIACGAGGSSGTGCWVGCRESTVHAVAKARCALWGGELARMETAANQTCVNAAFAGSARWLGLEQGVSTQVAGNWSWSGDGVALAYTNWAGGQPNDNNGSESGEEQCAYLSNPNGGWHDAPCTMNTGAFICYRP